MATKSVSSIYTASGILDGAVCLALAYRGNWEAHKAVVAELVIDLCIYADKQTLYTCSDQGLSRMRLAVTFLHMGRGWLVYLALPSGMSVNCVNCE